MEDKNLLNNEELEKVSGGNDPEIGSTGGEFCYSFKYLVCPECGLEVARDWRTPISANVNYKWASDEGLNQYLLCSRCGHQVGSSIYVYE